MCSQMSSVDALKLPYINSLKKSLSFLFLSLSLASSHLSFCVINYKFPEWPRQTRNLIPLLHNLKVIFFLPCNNAQFSLLLCMLSEENLCIARERRKNLWH